MRFFRTSLVISKPKIIHNDDIVAQYMVRNIPTIIFLKDGKQVDKHVGAATKEQLKAKIEAML